jgi:hypothetical protein
MFPVMKKVEIKRAKEKFKKPHFRGGFHAVLETFLNLLKF